MDRNQLLNDPETAMRYALDGRQAMMWTAFPAIVTQVDFTKMTLQAQPAIKGEQENADGSVTSVLLPLLVDVPICFPSAGGFTLTLPVKPDDEVLIIIANRCIDAWWQNGGVQMPMEARMHDLSDGFAIPGPRSVPNVVTGISTTGAQLRNDAGTTYVEISADGKIKLVTPSEVDITGNLKVTGTITATGEITAVTTPLHTHVHLSGTPGNPTGAPIP